MKRLCLWLLPWSLVVIAWSVSPPAPAQTSSPSIPAALKPWVPWVIERVPDAGCTWRHDAGGIAGCGWPGRLELELGDGGGSFSQTWSVDADTWILLPGSREFWPLEVRVDGESALVAERDGTPALRLQPGDYQISGTFNWSQLPQRLPVPTQTAIVSLRLSGEPVINPRREASGDLALRQVVEQTPVIEVNNRVEIAIFRRLIDDRPFQVHTRVILDVSGVEREIVLPGMFLEQAVALRLEGPLPIRLLADGRVQLQVRPGRLEYDLFSRLPGRVETVRRGAVELPLPTQEVWSFDARRTLRDVRPQGLAPVDPRQTRMPVEWQSLPAFIAVPDAELELLEIPRAEGGDPRDQFSLTREVWLDFDGSGYTLQDQVSGIAHGDQRLEVQRPIALGQVRLNGEPQLVTRLEGSSGDGFEVRPGGLHVVADSRIERADTVLPVSGWNRDLRDVSATLHLPPGWRLAAATGADQVQGAWVDQWSMLDMFMVLVLSVAALRVWGATAGIVALLALVLTWQSAGAPQYVWAPLLLASALVNVLKPGRLRRWMVSLRLLAIVAVIVTATPFLVRTASTVLFPQLERGEHFSSLPVITHDMRGGFESAVDMPSQAMAPEIATTRMKIPELMLEQAELPRAPGSELETALIQTGPGVPNWRWNSYQIRWNGPVDGAQTHELYLLSPWVNRGLDLARLLLSLALLALMTINVRRSTPRTEPAHAVTASLLAGALVLMFDAGQGAVAQSFPPPELLDELQRRVIIQPDCLPHCVSLQSVLITADESSIRVFYELTVLEDVAAPLLLSSPSWSADSVEIDGAPARVLGSDGQSLVSLESGHRLVEISGPVGDVDEVQLIFPLRPHRLVVESSTWQSSGMERAGADDRQLRLYRERVAAPVESPTTPPTTPATTPARPPAGLIAPFFEITRTLVLGLDVRVINELRRLSDPGIPVSLDVPLLEGESPLTNVSVSNGQVRATFAAGHTMFQWESALELTNPYVLQAPAEGNLVEHWRLDVDTRWHVRHRGVAPVLSGGERGPIKSWRPWPGETLELTLLKPQGVEGNTLTIDRSRMRLVPGREMTRAELSVSMRSSQGGVHALTLPEGANVQEARVDGEPLNTDPGQRDVTIPLRPGTREVMIEWLQPLSMEEIFRTPQVDLNAPSVNSTVELVTDQTRWLMWTHGPALGPAILYWGLLGVVLAAAIGLSRIALVPVKWWQWFLLGAGISHSSLWFAFPVLGWFLLAGYRRTFDEETPKSVFNLSQLALVLITPVMLWALVDAIQTGLLGNPDMQVAGNQSNSHTLVWFQDRTESLIPEALVVSVPLLAYRVLMLAWSLWLAFSLFNWMRWGWRAFSAGGTWRAIAWRRRKTKEDAPADA